MPPRHYAFTLYASFLIELSTPFRRALFIFSFMPVYAAATCDAAIIFDISLFFSIISMLIIYASFVYAAAATLIYFLRFTTEISRRLSPPHS